MRSSLLGVPVTGTNRNIVMYLNVTIACNHQHSKIFILNLDWSKGSLFFSVTAALTLVTTAMQNINLY